MCKKPFALTALVVLLTGALAVGYFLLGLQARSDHLANIIGTPMPGTMKIVAQSYSGGREGLACFQARLSAQDFSSLLARRKYERLNQGTLNRKAFLASTYRLFARCLPSLEELPAYELYEEYDQPSGATIYLIVDPAHTNLYVLHVRI